MTAVVPIASLPPLTSPRGVIPGRYLLEGRCYGLEHLSLVVGETAPGKGIALHRHEYEELFIVHAGEGTYIVGDDVVQAGPGDVVIIPSGVPHRFINNGSEALHHTAVHSSGTFAFDYQD